MKQVLSVLLLVLACAAAPAGASGTAGAGAAAGACPAVGDVPRTGPGDLPGGERGAAGAAETPRDWVLGAQAGSAGERRLLVPMLAGAVSLLVVLRAVGRAPERRRSGAARPARAAGAPSPRVGRYRRDPAAERCGRRRAMAALHLPQEAEAPSQPA